MIIVIAGIHNNLRNQTQGRIDEGFIGRDTGRLSQVGTREKPKLIGVAEFDDRFTPVSLINTIRDFNKATATSNRSQIASYAVPVVSAPAKMVVAEQAFLSSRCYAFSFAQTPPDICFRQSTV